ncbi:aldo/keto reductase [Thermoflavimicrobium daqui]|uniref:Aldo/keto reductase n=1 Tax=Thermoflavimicrobium daqui TaxID=2137476 RepID=A0A364K851_9BACL|nr:aldo/keto reductase [Thermoflavimicrobium daqui]
MRHIADSVQLHNGIKMPWLGLGTYKVKEGNEAEQAVRTALEVGYRSIDTAALYQNEEGVGKAIQDSAVSREEVFVTTKVWNTDQGYDETLRAFEESRSKLGLEYIDLYLIHWPVKEKFKETWRALEKLYQDGWVRAIGVSNFQIHHLEELKESCKIKPMVNQVEFHPLLTQRELLNYCQQEMIQLEAWSPLMRGNQLTHPTLTQLAAKYQKTPAQIILRWDLQHQVITIPKSIHADRIAENADIFDFELSVDDMKQIDAMNQNKRFGQHPDHFQF